MKSECTLELSRYIKFSVQSRIYIAKGSGVYARCGITAQFGCEDQCENEFWSMWIAAGNAHGRVPVRPLSQYIRGYDTTFLQDGDIGLEMTLSTSEEPVSPRQSRHVDGYKDLGCQMNLPLFKDKFKNLLKHEALPVIRYLNRHISSSLILDDKAPNEKPSPLSKIDLTRDKITTLHSKIQRVTAVLRVLP
jgi:hypothetical protein